MKASTCVQSRPAVDLEPPQCILLSKVTCSVTTIPLKTEGKLRHGICCFLFFSKVKFSFIAPLGQLGTKCLAHWEGWEIASHWLCYVRLMGSTRCYATSAKMMYGDTVSFKADM